MQNSFNLYYCTVYMQGFYQLCIALQGMDDHEEAMVAFSQGLATKNAILTALVETMLKCSLTGMTYRIAGKFGRDKLWRIYSF